MFVRDRRAQSGAVLMMLELGGIVGTENEQNILQEPGELEAWHRGQIWTCERLQGIVTYKTTHVFLHLNINQKL